MTHKFQLKYLETEANRRPPGYIDFCLKNSTAITMHGQVFLEFTVEQFNAVRKRFNPSAPLVKPEMKGLGDLVGKVATPIARALGMDCIDKSSGQLKPESPCQKRKEMLNNAVRFK